MNQSIILAKAVSGQLVRKPAKVLCLVLAMTFASLSTKGDVVSSDGIHGTQVFISLKNNQLPADDLNYSDKGKSRTLASGEARDLQTKSKLDLSTLNPGLADTWKGPSSAVDKHLLDDALPINNGDLVSFDNVPNTNKPYFKVNVQAPQSDGSSETISLLLSRDLHTLLLRKELLRRLGYVVPAMKYISKIRIKFKNTIEQNLFIKYPIVPTANPNILDWTDGATERWCTVAPQVLANDPKFPCKVDQTESDPLVIDFQDIMATKPEPLYPEPDPLDPKAPRKEIPIFNLALAPPINPDNISQGETDRIYRSLAVIYNLVNFPESINQADWYSGRIENEKVTFPLPLAANFGCSHDDAMWAIRRIGALTRSDFEQIVANSYFPDAVGKLVLEKVIARRNSLDSLFTAGISQMPFDSKITDPPSIKDGKIIQTDWPGYASHFAHGDYPSPIKGLKYYFLAELESNALDNLMAEANKEIPSLNVQNQTKNHINDIIKKLASGAITRVPIKAWVKPLAGINFTISRDVILGNYLGTNNMIQLVDTMGVNINAGITVGVDSLPLPYSVSGIAQGTLSLTLTHIKPITLLQQAVKETPKNLIVPLVFRGTANVLRDAFKIQQMDKGKSPYQIKEALSKDLDNLKNYIDVGESLIITESIQGSEPLTGGISAQVPWSPAFTATGGPNQGIIRRIQVYRKSTNSIQVFVDNGDYLGLTVGFYFTTGSIAQFPIVSIIFPKKIRGQGRSKIYTIDTNPDPEANKDIYVNSKALSQLLKTGSTEFLDANKNNKPSYLAVKFDDTTTSLQFLMLVWRHLKLNGSIFAQKPDGTSENFIALSDGQQSGKHYQSLATEAATYLIQRLSKDPTYGLNTQAAPNPGHSFLGSSKTRDIDYQATNDKTGIDNKFIRVQYRWEGWSKNNKEATDVINKEMNPKYGVKFFDDQVLHDITKIQLYELTTNLNIYQKAIDNLLAMTPSAEKALEKKFFELRRCDRYTYNISSMDDEDRNACAGLDKFENAFGSLRKGQSDPIKYSKDLMQLVGNFERFAPLETLIDGFGGLQNIFVNAVIQGYRVGSEVLSDPIYSTQSLGNADGDNPSGVVTSLEQELQIQDGEFYIQWIRDVL